VTTENYQQDNFDKLDYALYEAVMAEADGFDDY